MPPQRCLSCRTGVNRSLPLCGDCEADLPWQMPDCQRCGISLGDYRHNSSADVCNDTDNICLNCQLRPPHFDRCMPVFAYEAPVSGMIRRFKEHAGFTEARCLGHMLSAAFHQHYLEQNQPFPAFLLPVPLHNARIRQRGFNQALILCNAISARCGIPVLRHACHRHRTRHNQRGLTARERQLNVQGIFFAGKQSHLTAGRHIAIIDDVVTTTATVNAMSATLRLCGAAQIDVWSVARAN